MAFFETPHDAANELALPIFVLSKNDVALGIPDSLKQHLLCRLGGNAAKCRSSLLQVEHVAEFFILLACFFRVARVPEHLEAQFLAYISLETLSLIHISEPTRRTPISYAVF